MENHHRNAAAALAGKKPPSIRMLGEFLSEEAQPFEIPDPVGQDFLAFKACFGVLKRCLAAFIVHLRKEK
jgi:hypothetical protein